MNIPSKLKYTRSHEWIRSESDGSITVGITDHAQELLGDLVFIELPETGARLIAGQEAVVVESVKAASDVYSPVAGKVVAVNRALDANPELLNDAPYEQWIAAVAPEGGVLPGNLMTAEAYEAFVGEEG